MKVKSDILTFKITYSSNKYATTDIVSAELFDALAVALFSKSTSDDLDLLLMNMQLFFIFPQ